MDNKELKNKVKNYWNKQSCGTEFSSAQKYSRQYFDEIEDYRYKMEPEIFSFAQFTRFHGQKILEVGIGAGTDFMQWIRAGAKASGVDLTEEAVEHVKNRLKVYNLIAEEVQVADCENLPFADNTFDLVYSWGVIHHSPNTLKALAEIIRVTKAGGIIKVMIYNRRSLWSIFLWLRFGLWRGKSIAWTLFHHQESLGTKAYTINEIKKLLTKYPVQVNSIEAKVTKYDLLFRMSFIFRWTAYLLACIRGFNKSGFYLTFELKKKV